MSDVRAERHALGATLKPVFQRLLDAHEDALLALILRHQPTTTERLVAVLGTRAALRDLYPDRTWEHSVGLVVAGEDKLCARLDALRESAWTGRVREVRAPGVVRVFFADAEHFALLDLLPNHGPFTLDLTQN